MWRKRNSKRNRLRQLVSEMLICCVSLPNHEVWLPVLWTQPLDWQPPPLVAQHVDDALWCTIVAFAIIDYLSERLDPSRQRNLQVELLREINRIGLPPTVEMHIV